MFDIAPWIAPLFSADEKELPSPSLSCKILIPPSPQVFAHRPGIILSVILTRRQQGFPFVEDDPRFS